MTIPEKMKAFVLTGHGDMDKLVYHTDWPVPVPVSQKVCPLYLPVEVLHCNCLRASTCQDLPRYRTALINLSVGFLFHF